VRVRYILRVLDWRVHAHVYAIHK